MTIDKERLRVLAEAALSAQASSDWVTHAAAFEAATTPDVVLELLEELRISRQSEAEAWRYHPELEADRAALAAEVERLRKDAVRYQWLRSRLPGSAYRIAGVIYSEGGEGVDAAIDEAMADKGGVT